MLQPSIARETAILETVARACHEANREYCLTLGDESQVPWDVAPAWQQESCYNGVRGVLVDGNGPIESHASWMAEKLAAGWKYGPAKNAETKEHPCMVAYDDLPEAQRKKDDIFTETAKRVAAELGWSGASFANGDRMTFEGR